MKPDELLTKLKGPICLMFTPFKGIKSFEIDHGALRQNLRFLINGGIKIVALTDTAGECPELTDEERMAVWNTVMDEGRGEIITIVGNGHFSTKKTIEFTKYAEEIGIDGLITIAPYYEAFHDEGLYQHFKTVADSTSLGIIVDNSPRYSKVSISPSLLERLAQIPNIVAIKENGHEMPKFYDMIKIMDKYHKLVIPGAGDLWYFLGNLISDVCPGFTSLTANWDPESSLSLDDAIRKIDYKFIADYTHRMAPYTDMMFRIAQGRQHSSLAVAKEPMDMIEGLKGGKVRLPLTPLSDKEQSELRLILENLGLKLKK